MCHPGNQRLSTSGLEGWQWSWRWDGIWRGQRERGAQWAKNDQMKEGKWVEREPAAAEFTVWQREEERLQQGEGKRLAESALFPEKTFVVAWNKTYLCLWELERTSLPSTCQALLMMPKRVWGVVGVAPILPIVGGQHKGKKMWGVLY